MLQTVLGLRSVPKPEDKVTVVLDVTQSVVFKAAVCIALLSVGMYYLLSGKEHRNLERMVLGGLLIFGAFFVF